MSQYEADDTVTKELTLSSESNNEKGFTAYVKRNKVTVIIVVIIILIAIWYFFLRKKKTGDLTLANNSASKNVASSNYRNVAASNTIPSLTRVRAQGVQPQAY